MFLHLSKELSKKFNVQNIFGNVYRDKEHFKLVKILGVYSFISNY